MRRDQDLNRSEVVKEIRDAHRARAGQRGRSRVIRKLGKHALGGASLRASVATRQTNATPHPDGKPEGVLEVVAKMAERVGAVARKARQDEEADCGGRPAEQVIQRQELHRVAKGRQSSTLTVRAR